jgi:transposase InsO family protein
MIRKPIPSEVIVDLYHKLSNLSAKHPDRKILINETAKTFDVSFSTVRRAIKNYSRPRSIVRSDYNCPRKISKEEMIRYCELIAALKIRSTNRKGKQLSTPRAIDILENHGIDVEGTRITAPKGLLTKPTINRYLKRLGLTSKNFRCEPIVTRFQARYSNECWQLDFTPSELKYLPSTATKGESKSLLLASVVDDRSGTTYQEYHLSKGENVLMALRFLFNAMSKKTQQSMSFQGIPLMIYMDNGPVAKSLVFQRVCKQLGIEIRTHMPAGSDGRRTTARSKGKVERVFNTVQNQLETLYHFHKPSSLEEANKWLWNYLAHYNSLAHRQEKHSRLADWQANLPKEGYRQMCDWKRFSAMAREPDERRVASDACITLEGASYQLTEDMAGEKVIVLFGLFDNELYVEFQGQKHGPFYPAAGPIPLHTYSSFKKTKLEKQVNKVEILAKQLSLPLSVLTGEFGNDLKLLEQAKLISEDKAQAFVPFEDGNIEMTYFKTKIEAKLAIAKLLGKPLATISELQLIDLDKLIAESLHKATLLGKVQEYFKLKLVTNDMRSL